MRILVAIALLAGGFALGYLAGGRGSASTVASVNGERIAQGDLNRELEARFGAEVLNDMIKARLVAQEASKRKLTITPQELKKRVDAMLAEPSVKAMIEAGRVTRADLERNLATVMLLDKLILSSITTEQQKTYFEVHQDELEMVRARHILSATEEEAQRLEIKLMEGADFAQLAREYSLDESSRNKGGDLGYFRRGEIDPTVSEIAFQTEVGEVSSVVPTRFGYHLLQVTGKKDDFKSLQSSVQEAMLEARRTDFVKALEKGARIERKLVPKEKADK